MPDLERKEYPVSFGQNSWLEDFLIKMNTALYRLVWSTHEDLTEPMRGFAFVYFGHLIPTYTDDLQEYSLRPTILHPEDREIIGDDFDLEGFPSWLYISSFSEELYIIYDTELIENSTRDVRSIERRFELITLHEIGHARLHLSYLCNEVAKNKGKAKALPFHESEAWFYAYSVMGVILGLRAVILRILGDTDSAGLW